MEASTIKKRPSGVIIPLLLFLFDYNHIATIFFLLFSLSIFRVYDMDEIRGEYYLSKDLKKTWGTLDKKWEPETGPIVFGYDFSFVLPDRGMYKGTSYSKFDKFKEQDSVLIEYPPNAPTYSRIIKQDIMQNSLSLLWLGVFLFFISLSWFTASIIKTKRRIRLLREGELVKIRFKEYQTLRSQKGIHSEVLLNTKTYSYMSRGSKVGFTYRSALWKQVRLMEDEQYMLLSDKGHLILNRFPESLGTKIKHHINLYSDETNS